MDERILFNPENRFLASSGSNDFSLYGAAADPVLWFLKAAPPSPPDHNGASAAPATGEPAGVGQGEAAASPPAGASSHLPGSSDAGAAPPSTPPATQFAEAAPSAGAFATPLAPFAEGFTAPAVIDRTEIAQQELQPGAAPAATSEFVAAFAPGPAGTAEAVAAGAPGEALAGDILPEAAQGAIGPAVTGPLSEALSGVSAALEDGLTDLLGSDPAGGVATLVSLVTISEVLDVQTVAGADPVLASGPSMIDMLTADILGETAPADADAEDPAEGLITVPLPLPVDDLPGGL